MGQKSNPNILRLGKIKEWKSKYIEKKVTESSTIIFKNLEVQKFIYQLFMKNGLYIQDCKIAYSESSLDIYVAFYSSTRVAFTNIMVDQNKKIKLQNKRNSSASFLSKLNKVKRATLRRQLYTFKAYQKTFNPNWKKTALKKQYLLSNKAQRLKTIRNFKIYSDGKEYKTLNKQNLNLFTVKILKSLYLFVNKKQDVFLNLKQVNREKSLLQKMSKKNKQRVEENLMRLRKFQQNEFFKNGFNVLYNFVVNNPDPAFLAEFVASYLKKLKRPNFFLRFLKLALKTLTNKNFSRLERIQIKIKGRFNGAPRSSHKFVNVGKNIPVLTLNSKLCYGESTAYTSNGTFGIKVWTYSSTNYYV